MTKYILLLLIVSSYNLLAQPSIQWQYSYGGTSADLPYKVIATFDGGYMVAGISQSNNGNLNNNYGGYDCWITKLDSSGLLQWQKSFGGSFNDAINSIIQTSDSGFIFVGSTGSNDHDITFNHGSYDYWVVKLDTAGNILWQKTYGGSNFDAGSDMVQSSDGGFLIAGSSTSNDGDVSVHYGSSNDDDFWIVKIDSIGTLMWEKTFGGTLDDTPLSIAKTNDNSFIIGGYTYSNDSDVTFNHGQEDCWVIKIDSIGNLLWQKSFGGSVLEKVTSIIQTNDGGFAFNGFTNSTSGDVSGNHGNNDYWFVKLDSSGNIQWQKCFGGFQGDNGYSIIQTSDYGYALTGLSGSSNGNATFNHGNYDYWIIKTDSLGTIEWQKSLGGTNFDNAYSIIEKNTNEYVIAGSSNSNDGDVTGNHGLEDFWIVKLNNSVGINEHTLSSNIKLFPNPVGNFLNVEFPFLINDKVSISILNPIGEIIQENNLRLNNEAINVGNLKQGIYFLKVLAGDNYFTAKFIKN